MERKKYNVDKRWKLNVTKCSFGHWPAKNKETFQWFTEYCSTQCTSQDAFIKDKIIFQVIG